MQLKLLSPKKTIKQLLGFIVGFFLYATSDVTSVYGQASYFPELRGISYGDATDVVRQKKGEPIFREFNETKRQEVWRYSDIKVTFVNGKTNELEILKREPSLIGQSVSLRPRRRQLVYGEGHKRAQSMLETKSPVPFRFEKGEVLQLLKEISLSESSEAGSSPSQPQLAPPMIQGFRPPEIGRVP